MISVIISTYNSEKYIGGCLEAVLGSRGVEFEIIIVDAGSAESQKSKLKSQKYKSKVKSLKTIFLDENVGLTVSNNIGARMASRLRSRQAKGEYLLFLDVDTKIDKNALFEIVKFFEKNPRCGAVQGKLVDAKTNKVETMGHFLSPIGFPYEINKISNFQFPIFPAKDGIPLRRDNEFSNSNLQKSTSVIFGARGACLGIRREVFEKIGGFDEDYFMHNEETDLSWRVWLSGYKIYYLPKAEVLHFGKSHFQAQQQVFAVLTGSSPSGSRSCALKNLIASPLAIKRIYYEGAKNQITTIIKNADLKMILWMLPLNILGWVIMSFKFLITGKINRFCWIYQGIGRACLDLGKTIKKRKKVIRKRGNEAEKVMFGDISFFDLVKKGWQWSRSL